MNDDALTDDELRRLLTSVTIDGSVEFPDKDDLRRRFVDEYRTPSPSGEVQADGMARRGSTADDSVVELAISLSPDQTTRSWRRLALVAAAAVIAVISAVALLAPDSPDSMVASEPRSIDANVLGDRRTLEPGLWSTDALAGGLELETPSSVVVDEIASGLLVLRPVDDPSTASLTIMVADEALAALLDAARDAGSIDVVVASARSSTGPVDEYEVRLQPDAPTDGCPGGRPCLEIGVVTIRPGTIVMARALDTPDGGELWAVFESERVDDQFQRLANDILESVVITGNGPGA